MSLEAAVAVPFRGAGSDRMGERKFVVALSLEPDGFTPDESILREGSAFERVLDRVVAAGTDKQSAVAAINARQRDLGVTLEAAAVLYARSEGVDVADVAERIRTDLRER